MPLLLLFPRWELTGGRASLRKPLLICNPGLAWLACTDVSARCLKRQRTVVWKVSFKMVLVFSITGEMGSLHRVGVGTSGFHGRAL